MQITRHTDLAFRLLMYLAVHRGRTTVESVAEAHRVSPHHLFKVVNSLAELGVVERVRGRGGGISLNCEPSAVNLGKVFRSLENLNLVECFSPEKNACVIARACELHGVLKEALEAFCSVLDKKTLADLIHREDEIQAVLLGVME